MTEADWLTTTDFETHVRFVADRLSPRRSRLLAAGFCRAASSLFDLPDLIAALAVVEEYADGLAPVAELDKARQFCRALALRANEAYTRHYDGGLSGAEDYVRRELGWAVSFTAGGLVPVVDVGTRAAHAAVQARTGAGLLQSVADTPATAEQARVMLGVVWDVVGNPFRPVAFEPTWRTDTVVSLARQVYESREFGALPILADALQDAGCDNSHVLTHCRHESGHVRGCWVLDGVLGKE
ncbi:hypothetical protein [Frigoriglobus tundricola]|uniref:Uncharacterized protein n=1 Tax=Frigoriglobus tundricola TaxID=2774151 RepID=A0A6M5YGM0_9BACT|nr:hypothetical protein [Frigoriglobus tundricola]QJW93189.1 hypothetical protein FTUN_0694 [Frigoriglobus tundricola]